MSPLPSTPSSAALTTLSSPPLKSPNPNQSPIPRSPSIPKNYHPYLIQSTSSSLLTRSNSSPTQPATEYRHKPSRSMSSLAASASEGELDKVAKSGVSSKEERERRRRSMESPLNRPGMRRSGTLPVFPRVDEVVTPIKGLDLPNDPKKWSPSELARYLAHTLRTGGPDGNGQILPAPLVKDIETWVLRQQVNGKAFLKGNQESWTTSSRPPPFLPLLMSISRRLRRNSLQARLSAENANASFSPSPLNPDSPRPHSVLLEEDEDYNSDDDSPISGVKRLAIQYENQSTPDLSEDLEPLKPQWTGGSSTSEVWRRWEDMGVGVRRKRRESERSLGAGSLADEEVSPEGMSRSLSSGSGPVEVETPIEEIEDIGGTVKAPPPGLGLGLGLGVDGDAGETTGKGKESSPPPPYRSPDPEESAAQLPIPLEQALDTPPNRMRLSVTPTPDRPRIAASTDADTPAEGEAGEIEAQVSPHMGNMASHHQTGSNPYAALRRTSSSGRVPTSRRVPSELNLDSDTQHNQSTSRRVTIRPNRADSLFAPSSPPVKSPREAELEDQLSHLISRVKELESKLETVSHEVSRQTASAPASPISREMTRPGSPVGMLPESILVRLGLLPEREGLPTRMRELPGYLFLVGVGVGAVVVRVFMKRK